MSMTSGVKRFLCLLLLFFTSNSCVGISTKKNASSAHDDKLVHLNPMNMKEDPYTIHEYHTPPLPTDEVCAVVFDENNPKHYRTETFSSLETARAHDAYVTHTGPCGACSSLQDFAVYQNNRDLTSSGRRCGFVSWLKPMGLSCFKALGFSEPCAHIWLYNARNTGAHCFWVCMKSFFTFEKNNLDDGSLNACLACDEEKSGPVFKNVARRTRRNSGLTSEIERPSYEIAPLQHNYGIYFR